MKNSKRNILVFTEQVLPFSATFIRSQMEALLRFEPHYVGLRLSHDIALPIGRAFALNRGQRFGRAQESWFKLTGRSEKIEQEARRINPALIHAHFGPNGALALYLRRMLDIPLIVTFHGYDATTSTRIFGGGPLHLKFYSMRRPSLRRAGDLFIAVSDFIKNKLLEQGFPEERTRTHYIGIDTDCFKPDPRISREPIVLFVGRLIEKKGCKHLIEAFSRVRQSRPGLRLVLIGDGPERKSLEALARENNLPCQFLGKQPSSSVKDWMNRAMVLCVPSVTAKSGDSEGLPMVVLEASAMGLPVVGTHHAGIPEAIVHTETGFLVPEKNEAALVDALSSLLSNQETWHKFHIASMQNVRNRFCLRRQTALLEGIYESTLESYRSAKAVPAAVTGSAVRARSTTHSLSE